MTRNRSCCTRRSTRSSQLGNRSDPGWDRLPEAQRPFFFGDEPYWFADTSDDDVQPAKVIGTIKPFPSWGGGGYLTTSDLGERVGHELDKAMLSTIASGVQHIVCGAFDAESFVVWHRNPEQN